MTRDAEHTFEAREQARRRNGQTLSAVLKCGVRAYYEFHPTGGPLHIVTDDYNTEDSDLDYCERSCALEGDVAGIAIIGMLRRIDSTMGREAVLRGEHVGWPTRRDGDRLTASGFYCHSCLERPTARFATFGTTVACSTCDMTGFLIDGSDDD